MSEKYAPRGSAQSASGLDSAELTAFYDGRMMNPATGPITSFAQGLHNLSPNYSSGIKQQLSQSLHGKSEGNNYFGIGVDATSVGTSNNRASRAPTMTSKPPLLSDCDVEEGSGRERKRRDNINEKIQELLALIPPSYFEATEETAGHMIKVEKIGLEEAVLAALRNSGTKDGKPNKGQILTKLVTYLQDMQTQIDKANRKEVELRSCLMKLELKVTGNPLASLSEGRHTIAEQALGEIGVGPLSQDYFTRSLTEPRSDTMRS